MIHFTIIDAVDILIVSFLIYSILRFFRGVRALQMFLGLFAILLFIFIGNIFRLPTLRWIMSGLSNIWLVLFVILFQTEIKKGIKFLGSRGVTRYLLKEEREKIAQEITEAAEILSDKRIGAIIVIERNTLLDLYFETGIKMEAAVDANLIVSIFSPFSPLHDGSVIIKGQYIVAAKCVLPLSTNPNLSPTLGTRHRAAIGITEETDAICIVVSEETGTISLAEGGELQKDLEPEMLKARILKLSEKGG